MHDVSASPVTMPLIGDKAPSFEAETTQGKINFPKDYKGKWVILFSHPADFTPVCTTEFITFASQADEFRKLNCELIGLSVDGVYSHIAWLRTIEEKIEFAGHKNVKIDFPLIADTKMEVANAFGMLHAGASNTHTVRAVFVIDPDGVVRAILYYPLTNGRHVDEIKRLLVSLQTSDKHGVATPANWQPGDPAIIPPPTSSSEAEQRVAGAGQEYQCKDWFLCLKKLDEK
jgi:peroxiredoxin (alkyl hydroperoxide reductase subunit C)